MLRVVHMRGHEKLQVGLTITAAAGKVGLDGCGKPAHAAQPAGAPSEQAQWRNWQ